MQSLPEEEGPAPTVVLMESKKRAASPVDVPTTNEETVLKRARTQDDDEDEDDENDSMQDDDNDGDDDSDSSSDSEEEDDSSAPARAAEDAEGTHNNNNNNNILNLEVEDTSDDDELYRRILQAAAASGISLDFLQAAMQRDSHQDDPDEEVDYPFDAPPQSLRDVANFIQSPKCRKILVLAGAGMSKAAGIPDFRSSDGFYATLDASRLTATIEQQERIAMDPCYCLDQHLFLENPLPCLEVNRQFLLGVRDRQWKATLAHRFVEALQQHGKLCRLYTQNIDGLEDQCPGLPHEQRIAVHGSMDEAACAMCNYSMPFLEFCALVETQIKDITGQHPTVPQTSTPIRCRRCGSKAVKPDIVLFRSSLPKRFFQQVPVDTKDVDLLLIVGTSLHVAPANSLVWRVPRCAMRVLLNREAVGWHVGLDFEQNPRDYFGQGDCEDAVLDLMQHLGWLESLRPCLERGDLPQGSCELLRKRLEGSRDSPAIISGTERDTTETSSVGGLNAGQEPDRETATTESSTIDLEEEPESSEVPNKEGDEEAGLSSSAELKPAWIATED